MTSSPETFRAIRDRILKLNPSLADKARTESITDQSILINYSNLAQYHIYPIACQFLTKPKAKETNSPKTKAVKCHF